MGVCICALRVPIIMQTPSPRVLVRRSFGARYEPEDEGKSEGRFEQLRIVCWGEQNWDWGLGWGKGGGLIFGSFYGGWVMSGDGTVISLLLRNTLMYHVQPWVVDI